MRTDFAAMGKSVREQIVVPALPMESIRRRSRRGQLLDRARVGLMLVAILVALAGGFAAAGEIARGFHAWLVGNNMAVSFNTSSSEVVQYPTIAKVRSLIRRAPFPVTLPVGLPTGAYIDSIIALPADKPTNLMIAYRDASGRFLATVDLLDSAVTDTSGGPPMPFPRGPVDHWLVGGEVVVVSAGMASGLESAIRAAMAHATPTSALASASSALSPAIILGNPVDIALARRLVPPNATSVLLDHAYFPLVQRAAEEGTSLKDLTTVVWPSMRQTLNSAPLSPAEQPIQPAIALSRDGVRALYGVMKADPCVCAYLVTPRNTSAFDIWVLQKLSHASPVKYHVDARARSMTRY